MPSGFTGNHGLFSDHYLRVRLGQQAEWGGDYGGLQARMFTLLSEKAGALATLNEPQTEQQFIRPVLQFIRPVLDALGWSYETQITFRALGREYRPDYALFLSDDISGELARLFRGKINDYTEPH